MLLVNYLDEENKPTPYISLSVKNNEIKFSVVEKGTASVMLKSHEAYFIMLRVIKKEHIPNEICFENTFFGDKQIRIVSRSELLEEYNIHDYISLEQSMISTVSFKRIGRIITGDINNNGDIIFSLSGNLDNINIKTSLEVKYQPCYDKSEFDDKNFFSILWDSFSLITNNIEYKNYNFIDNKDIESKKIISLDADYIDFDIKKYKGSSFFEKCDGESHNDILYIQTNVGSLDYEEIHLKNGCGSFRVYLNGYKGILSIDIKYNKLYLVNHYEFFIE